MDTSLVRQEATRQFAVFLYQHCNFVSVISAPSPLLYFISIRFLRHNSFWYCPCLNVLKRGRKVFQISFLKFHEKLMPTFNQRPKPVIPSPASCQFLAMSISAQLSAIASSNSEQKAKTEEYKAVLAKLAESKEDDNLSAFVEHSTSQLWSIYPC